MSAASDRQTHIASLATTLDTGHTPPAGEGILETEAELASEEAARVKGFVNHGANAAVARPPFASVEWRGTVQPTNATSVDTWVNA